MKKVKKILTFERLGKYFKCLPSPLVGELVTALFDMWEKKYGDEPFELDYVIIDVGKMGKKFKMLQRARIANSSIIYIDGNIRPSASKR